jgi:hypothetical protein
MIKPEDITVSVPCLFPDRQPIWMMERSCERFGYQLRPYGIGCTYDGWIDIKVKRLREEALTCPTSHILYTDGRDAFFLAGPEEVAEKYNALGCPPLMLSAQCDIFGSYGKWYEGIPWDMTKKFRYVGTPGQLCEAKALADALGWMQENYHLGEDDHGLPDDDPPWWIEYLRAHPGQPKFDHQCAIFMNAGSECEEGMWGSVLEIVNGRLHNRMTDEWPCLVHFNGGYSHQQYGKWESLEQHWKKFGYTERPPWEA